MNAARAVILGKAVTALVSGTVLTLVVFCTGWAAIPLWGALHTEFGWSPSTGVAAAVASLVASAACLRPSLAIAARAGPRMATTAACLASGASVLLGLPNLTHAWQLVLLGVAIGAGRSLVVAGIHEELGWTLSARLAASIEAAAAVVGLPLLTPWISLVVYRNSWREGAATVGGVLLVGAAPLAYVLFHGVETRTGSRDNRETGDLGADGGK